MIIKKITAESFGKLKNKTIEFSDGINVINGANESGKSSLARCIRFLLYGFTSRNTDISKNDKKKYQPWDGSPCKGSMELVTEKGAYTVRREQATRALHSVTDSDGVPVFKGENAGESLLGVNEDTYDKTALISAGDVYFDDAVSLSSAIKNMVFSADSSVDSEGAIKKLENLRKSILGKTERSGRLYEARLEMAELSERKNALSELHKDLLSAETMLEKIKANIDRNLAAIDELEKEKRNIDAHEATLQLEKINELKAKADESLKKYTDKAYELTVDGFLPDRAFLSELNESVLKLEGEINAVKQAEKERSYSEEMLKECYSDKKQLEFNNKLKDIGKDADSVKKDVDELKMQMKTKKKFATVFSILFFLIITIPLAIVFWNAHVKIKKQLEKLCKEFGCETVEELDRLISGSDSASSLVITAKTRLDEAEKALDEAYLKRASAIDKICTLLSKSGNLGNFEGAEDAVIFAKECIRKLGFSVESLEALERKMSLDKAAFESCMGSISDFEALKTLAQSFDESIPLREVSKNAKELDFYIRATEGLRVQERDYEKKAAVMASNMDKPDELASKISLLEAEINELELKHRALTMASAAIEKAHESMRGNVSPILTSGASELFSAMTDGKYKGLYVDNDLKLSFLEEGSAEYRSVDYLSSGAADAAYLALRITLTEYLYDEKPTLIFDDAFSRLDDARLSKVCGMLKKLSSEYQIFVFTCHDREIAMLQPDALIKM